MQCVKCGKEFDKIQECQTATPTGEIKNGKVIYKIKRGLCFRCYKNTQLRSAAERQKAPPR